MSKVIVVGGGPAGMTAAIAAAQNGNEVILAEKNEKLGKKLYITGKGRCNLTNAGDMDNLFENVMTNPRFLYSAFYACDNRQVIDFFEQNGMKTKIERGNRVFPVSDHSSDVIRTLQKVLQEKRVRVMLHTEVEALLTEPCGAAGADGGTRQTAACRTAGLAYSGRQTGNSGTAGAVREPEQSEPCRTTGQEEAGNKKKKGYAKKVTGIRLKDGSEWTADRVILATGGFSYQTTGSTGDGYRFAEEAGHTVTEITPSLVPFYTDGPYAARLQGLSLKNVRIRILDGKKLLYEEFGEMLFTHFGVSGPLILSASAAIPSARAKKRLSMEIDLKPALTGEQLDARLLREFDEAKNKQFRNAIGHLFPAKMVPVMLELCTIAPERQVNGITREERLSFVRLIKAFPLTLNGPRDFNEAIITRGGVKTGEVNPSTMESKIVKNLYFCGELLDLDAMTGGYNLQIAWSTGYLAGRSASDSNLPT